MNDMKHKIGFALCIEDTDCEDLEKGKVYQVLSDEAAEQEGYVRASAPKRG